MVTGVAGCGLKYAVKRSGAAVGYCSLSIQCGTRDEGSFPEGTAHFVEHTVFKGTSRRRASAINSCLDRLGGELNAYTTKEETVLHATVLKEDIGKALGLLMDLASSPTFPDNAVETERGVIIDEISAYKDSPSEEIYDRFEEMLFAGHPLGRRILGKVSTVKKITGSDLRRFTRERFVPQRMAIAVVADEDERKMEEKLLRMIPEYFGDKVPEDNFRTAVCPAPEKTVFDLTVEKRNHEANAVFGALAPTLHEGTERYSTSLLANILGGPSSISLLNSELRERRGWVYNVEASYNPYSDSGAFTIALGCDRSNMEKCSAAVARIISGLQDRPMTDARLKAAKKQFLGQMAIGSDNGEAQCLSMGKSLLAFGRVNSDGEIRERILAVTAENIMDAARSILGIGAVSRLIFL